MSSGSHHPLLAHQLSPHLLHLLLLQTDGHLPQIYQSPQLPLQVQPPQLPRLRRPGNYEEEWGTIVSGAFPVQAAREAAEGRPAVAAFTISEQRLLVSKTRTAYRLALAAEQDASDTKAQAKADQLDADFESG